MDSGTPSGECAGAERGPPPWAPATRGPQTSPPSGSCYLRPGQPISARVLIKPASSAALPPGFLPSQWPPRLAQTSAGRSLAWSASTAVFQKFPCCPLLGLAMWPECATSPLQACGHYQWWQMYQEDLRHQAGSGWAVAYGQAAAETAAVPGAATMLLTQSLLLPHGLSQQCPWLLSSHSVDQYF